MKYRMKCMHGRTIVSQIRRFQAHNAGEHAQGIGAILTLSLTLTIWESMDTTQGTKQGS